MLITPVNLNIKSMTRKVFEAPVCFGEEDPVKQIEESEETVQINSKNTTEETPEEFIKGVYAEAKEAKEGKKGDMTLEEYGNYLLETNGLWQKDKYNFSDDKKRHEGYIAYKKYLKTLQTIDIEMQKNPSYEQKNSPLRKFLKAFLPHKNYSARFTFTNEIDNNKWFRTVVRDNGFIGTKLGKRELGYITDGAISYAGGC